MASWVDVLARVLPVIRLHKSLHVNTDKPPHFFVERILKVDQTHMEVHGLFVVSLHRRACWWCCGAENPAVTVHNLYLELEWKPGPQRWGLASLSNNVGVHYTTPQLQSIIWRQGLRPILFLVGPNQYWTNAVPRIEHEYTREICLVPLMMMGGHALL